MSNFQSQIQDLLIRVSQPFLPENANLSPSVEPTASPVFGDYTSNFAMQCFKVVKNFDLVDSKSHRQAVRFGSAVEMANALVAEVKKDLPAYLEDVRAAGP